MPAAGIPEFSTQNPSWEIPIPVGKSRSQLGSRNPSWEIPQSQLGSLGEPACSGMSEQEAEAFVDTSHVEEPAAADAAAGAAAAGAGVLDEWIGLLP